MITVKNSQLNNETVSILNNLMEMDIKASGAFRLMRIIKELSHIIEDKLTMEKKILNKWAYRDDNGGYMPVLGEDGSVIPGAIKITNIIKFEEEMSGLLSVENILSYDKIKFEELNLGETLKIKDLMKIEFIFE